MPNGSGILNSFFELTMKGSGKKNKRFDLNLGLVAQTMYKVAYTM